MNRFQRYRMKWMDRHPRRKRGLQSLFYNQTNWTSKFTTNLIKMIILLRQCLKDTKQRKNPSWYTLRTMNKHACYKIKIHKLISFCCRTITMTRLCKQMKIIKICSDIWYKTKRSRGNLQTTLTWIRSLKVKLKILWTTEKREHLFHNLITMSKTRSYMSSKGEHNRTSRWWSAKVLSKIRTISANLCHNIKI